jgi:hypothetical protein
MNLLTADLTIRAGLQSHLVRTVNWLVKLLSLLTLTSLITVANGTDDRFTPCASADKFIEIMVTARTIPASTSTQERRVWVLTTIPVPEQVVVAAGDTVLRDRILEILQMIRDSGVEVGVGKGGDPQPGDPPQLELQLADLDSVRPGLEIVLPTGLTASPQLADLNQIKTVRICLKYDLEPVTSQGVEIQIRTAKGEASPLERIPAFTLADAAERFSRRPEGAIVVHIAYAQQDLDDARKDRTITTEAAAVARVQSELLNVAVASFDKAVTGGLLNADGKPLVDKNSGQATAANVEGEIAKLYNLNGLDPKVRWGVVVPRVGVRDNSPAAPWIISITGLELAQHIDIEVIKSSIEMEFDGSETERKFDFKRQRVRDGLREAHLPRFSAQPGRIVTTENIAKDQKQLLDDTQTVQGVGDITSGSEDTAPPQQDLIYSVSRYLKDEKILSLRIGAGYTPEEQVTGGVAIDETNLLGVSENAKLAFAVGPQTQRIRFSFDRPFETVETAGWHVKSLGIHFQYFRDRNVRFSNLTPDEIEAKEAGTAARVSVAYDSFSLLDHATADCLENPDRKRTRLFLLATPVFAYRDVNIKDDRFLRAITHIDNSLLPQARTQTTTLSLDGNLGFSHDFRKLGSAGLGFLNLSFQGRLQRGFRFFGADYDYNKVNATLTSEILFGFISARDLLVRYNRVMSTSTHGTPLFELPRLGGPQSVRGLEEGEFIGRKLSADQFEVGINALIVWHLINRRPVAETLLKTSCTESVDETSPKLPFDINNAYLKFFYDRGRIHDRDIFVDPGSFTRTAQGYGVAIEVRELGGRNINLSLGYAYSPESVLHKSGTIYTGVSYAF